LSGRRHRSNDDQDAADGVVQAYDVAADRLVNSGSAVTPGTLESCDPNVPYRVGKNTVTFLTIEAEQGEYLNSDDDMDDVVLQFWNVRAAGAPDPRVLGSVGTGVCTAQEGSAHACVSDADCTGQDTCQMLGGQCVLALGTPCCTGLPAPQLDVEPGLPPLDPGGEATCSAPACPDGAVCKGTGTTTGPVSARGHCRDNADCEYPAQRAGQGATCKNETGDILRLAARSRRRRRRADSPASVVARSAEGQTCASSEIVLPRRLHVPAVARPPTMPTMTRSRRLRQLPGTGQSVAGEPLRSEPRLRRRGARVRRDLRRG
jgi:hypothetical protein